MNQPSPEALELLRALQRLEDIEDLATKELESKGLITVNRDGICLTPEGDRVLKTGIAR